MIVIIVVFLLETFYRIVLMICVSAFIDEANSFVDIDSVLKIP